jgi:RNA polymerase sigma-70 factor (ECF subfamily)
MAAQLVEAIAFGKRRLMAENSVGWAKVSDEELAALCARRPVDEDAWEAFYERHREFVQGQVRRILKGPNNELDDIVQEAFVKIFRALPSYDQSRARPKTFMSHVIANLVIDYIRHGALARAKTTSLDADVGVLRIRSTQNPELLGAAAEQIVKKLADKALVDLMLDLLHGKDVKRICAERNLNEAQVYAARNWLRNTLREISATFPKH